MSKLSSVPKNEQSQSIDMSERSLLVRQDRIEVSDAEAIIEIGEEKFDVANFNQFGIAILSNSPIAVSPAGTVQAKFIFEKKDSANLTLRKVREDILPGHKYKVAFEILSEPLNIRRIQAIHKSSSFFSEFAANQKSESILPAAFKKDTLLIRDMLETLRYKCNEFARTLSIDPHTDEQALIEEFSNQFTDFLNATFDGHIRGLAGHLTGLNEEEAKYAYGYFREKLGAILYEAPFSSRSYNKPLGYAGDFEMMNMIYKHTPIGPDLFSKSLHRYMVSMPGGNAVRNRAYYLKEKMKKLLSQGKKEKKTVLSVASGPAFEVQLLIGDKMVHDKLPLLELTLLDQDLNSLKYAQKKIKESLWDQNLCMSVSYLNKTIRHVLGSKFEGKYDLIYSAGLFDYFSDPVAQLVAKKLYSHLAKDGALIIGNFDTGSPSKFFMELAWDWNLIHRSRSDLLDLFGPITPNVRVEEEGEGINLFCILSKDG